MRAADAEGAAGDGSGRRHRVLRTPSRWCRAVPRVSGSSPSVAMVGLTAWMQQNCNSWAPRQGGWSAAELPSGRPVSMKPSKNERVLFRAFLKLDPLPSFRLGLAYSRLGVRSKGSLK